ncbi:MAG: diaminopimelate epimerase [bacterium]|nr:diaminopimelate epimerase [bacterium]
MNQLLKFSKMHGAGNDFVMLAARDLAGFELTAEVIQFLCDRRVGVGADGLIVIDDSVSTDAAFRMIYFNSDGYEAEMCGNGARCSVAFAFANQLADDNCCFDTYSGLLKGKVFSPTDIQVSLPAWKDLQLDISLQGDIGLGNSKFSSFHTCNTGVPHLVVPCEDVQTIDVLKWGSAFRHNPQFSPAGTNVNFVSPGGSSPEEAPWQLRTFERGVEDETLACGTGASACAVVLSQLRQAQSPVSLKTRGGDVLQVSVDFQTHELLLRGPAETSFQGEIKIHD